MREDLKPRPFDLNDPQELTRLYQELRGYLHTCRHKHHGTDFDGRLYAMDALEKLLAGVGAQQGGA